MLKTLNGTEFSYTLRNTVYKLRLNVNDYEMSTEKFSVKSTESFGASFDNRRLIFFPRNREETVLKISGKSELPVNLSVNKWSEKNIALKITSTDEYTFILEGLNPAAKYTLTIDGKTTTLITNNDGTASFSHKCTKPASFGIYNKER